ncbi:MAG: PAS domain S-box protein [Deltaproteobacteria bacterium]|nr:PAS domain S-box protein [Deltaproteobacteria bacterium]
MKKLKISRKPFIAVALSLAIILTFVALTFFSHEEKVENIIMSQAEQQMLTVSETNASRIREYVLNLSRSLKIITTDRCLKHYIMNGFPKSEIDLNSINKLYEHHKDQADSFAILDDRGIMLRRYPFWEDNKNRIGTDHTDKPGVAYVVKERMPYISEVFYNNLGKLAFSISEPVFDNDKFIGLVRWMISLSHVTDYFIQPIIAGRKICCVFVIDENGTIIIHDDSELIGKNIIAYKKEKFPEHDWSEFEGIVEKIIKGESGAGAFNSAFMAEDELEIEKKLIAYVPVKMGTRKWSVCAAIDYAEIADPIKKHEADHIKITVIIAVLFLTGGIIFYRLEKRRSAELSQKNIELKQEITERIKTDEALRESEQKLFGIVGSVTDAMIMVDNQYNVVWNNDIAMEVFGPDKVGNKCYKVYRGRDKVCEPCIVKKCFEDSKVHEFETRIVGSDGDRMRLCGKASVAAWDENGRPKMVVESLRDITDRENAQKKIETLMQQMEYILGVTKTGIDIIDSEFNVRYIDPEWQKVYGDPAGIKCYKYFMDRSEVCPECGIVKALETKTPAVTEEVLVKEGNRPIQVTTIPFQNDKGKWLVAEVNVDITERKQVEKTLQIAYDQSLIYAEELKAEIKERTRAEKEKEVLLREIHHRVKNNMQVISSLLKLQSKSVEDKRSLEMLKESQDRIRAMALVHEKLYESEDLANIDFNEYIEYLTKILFRSYAVNREKIRLKLNVERVRFKIDKAIPCGLIVNELVLNSLKHAFADGDSGEIEVSLLFINENEVELAVSDNGIGVPEGIDFNNTGSLGLKLVNILTDQIDGKLHLDQSKGTKFQIRFKM